MLNAIKYILGLSPPKPPPGAPDWLVWHYGSWSGFDKKTPVDSIRFLVFDTETSGLDPKKDRILSIGGIGVGHGRVKLSDAFEVFVKQASTGDRSSIPIHGLIGSDLAKGLDEAEALKQFLIYAEGAVLVAHNASFDMAMLNQSAKRHLRAKVMNPYIDTFALANRVDGNSQLKDHFKGSDYTLDALCKRYDIPQDNRHNAAGDALATATLFIKLYHLALKRGIDTIGNLLRT